MVAAAGTRLVSDVITNVTRQFGDESGVQITQTDIIRAINQGCMQIQAVNNFKKAVFTTAAVSGQQQYTLPTDILRIEAVKLGNYLLEKVNFADALNTLDGATTGGSSYWYWEFGGVINVYPIPLSSTTDTVTVYYSAVPRQVVATSDTLDIPDMYYETIIEFVMSKMYELDEDWDAHSVQRSLFEANVKTFTESDTTQGGYFQTITELDFS